MWEEEEGRDRSDMIIKAGDYTTKSGHMARIYRDSKGMGALAAVIGIGIVGYDNEGRPVAEEAKPEWALDLGSWREMQGYGIESK